MVTNKPILNLVSWCDQIIAQGKSLSLEWDGGNDSGSMILYIDDEETDDSDPHVSYIINHGCDQLIQGGFNGNFYCNGKAEYDITTKCFKGTDESEEEGLYTHKLAENEITLEIPKDVWFDSIDYRFDGDACRPIWSNINIHMQNGFKTEIHTKIEELLKKSLDRQINAAIDRYEQSNDDFNYIHSNDNVIPKSSFVDKGDTWVFEINEVDILCKLYRTADFTLDVMDLNKKLKSTHEQPV